MIKCSRSVLLLGGVMALAVAGCSDKDSSSMTSTSNKSSTTSTATTTTTEDKKVAVLSRVTDTAGTLTQGVLYLAGDTVVIVGGIVTNLGQNLPAPLGGTVVLLGGTVSATGIQVADLGDVLKVTFTRIGSLSINPLLGTDGLLGGTDGLVGNVTTSVLTVVAQVGNSQPLSPLLAPVLNPVLNPLLNVNLPVNNVALLNNATLGNNLNIGNLGNANSNNSTLPVNANVLQTVLAGLGKK